MTSIAKKKAACGYVSKLVPSTCGNCAHFACDKELPAWMQMANRNRYSDEYTAEKHGIEKNLRCARHGFAVKKMGTCNDWATKQEGGAA